MVRVIADVPSVENTELLDAYIRTAPHLLSSIATAETYLLRFASNIWSVEIPGCTFHPELNSIRLPFDVNGSVALYIPYQRLSQLSINNIPHPETNTITLQMHREVYLLSESLLVRLPTTGPLHHLYPFVSYDEGIIFSIPYLDIRNHRITDNLTKLNISFSTGGDLVLSPMQRFPPQPLSTGIFKPFANLTPLQSLQLANDAIFQGIDLAKNMISFYNTIRSNPLQQQNYIPSTQKPSSSSDSSEGSSAPLTGTSGTDVEYMLPQSGQADDLGPMDSSDLRLDTFGGMDIEIVGGFNSTGVKRSRRESDDASLPSSAPVKPRLGNL